MHDKLPRPITVSIVSHGQLGLIKPLLDQLERFCPWSIDKIVLTVNVPESDALADSRWAFPIERVLNPHPQGFGANHNAAFAKCETEWFLVLNPDIRLNADVLSPLLSCASTDSGLLAPRIIEPGKDAPEPHRALLTPCEILLRKRKGYRAPQHPVWVPGMFMLLRARAFHSVAGFDSRFFMYGEDFDLCARLTLAGWNIQVAENTWVTHDARRSSRRHLMHLRWHVVSLLKVWASNAFWRLRARKPPIYPGC